MKIATIENLDSFIRIATITVNKNLELQNTVKPL